ncbi:hypothetical protein M569_02391, partial [Genlisea aurea]
MDPEETFIRVQERFAEILSSRIRRKLEYFFLFLAVTLFCILVVMHANYVRQPGCSRAFSNVQVSDAQLIQITITSAGLWVHDESPNDTAVVHDVETEKENERHSNLDEGSGNKDALRSRFFVSPRESLRAAMLHVVKKLHWRLSFVLGLVKRIFRFIGDVAGINLNFDIMLFLKVLHLDKLNSFTVQLLERRTKVFEPAYLYTFEKGYILLPEEAKSRHGIQAMNIGISARDSCFGNRWQQLLINRVVGYDTIMMNSLLNSPGKGYLYNYQTKELYNLTYAREQPESSAKFGDYLVTKSGVLMMSLFVFFTTTMSVSFTLRETQTRMLRFTVQLQHHARHRLPTFQLIFVHVIESLVFVPIMIGILFFLFEFYDDQLLAFMVLILVWICELFTLISVRTPISMKFFPRFFLLYFLVFHIYFFSYTYGFSYLALSTCAAFMQHLILYFWNRFEVPALQRFTQHRRSQHHPGFHITSSTILASTLRITRLRTRNADGGGGGGGQPPRNVANDFPAAEPPAAGVVLPGPLSAFSSLLLWILGGASSEGLNSFLSIFRDFRDHHQGGQVYTD